MSQSSVATDAVPEVRSRKARKFTLSSALNVFGPFLILAFVVGLFATIMPAEVRENFFGIYNFKLILTQTVIVAIGALGMTMIIVSGGIDLSVGSIVALTSVVGARLLAAPSSDAWGGLSTPWSTPAVIGATVLMGGIIGAINGSI